jgi:hypothetical protein
MAFALTSGSSCNSTDLDENLLSIAAGHSVFTEPRRLANGVTGSTSTVHYARPVSVRAYPDVLPCN